MTDWLLRVGDGKNLISSSKYKIWGIQSSTADSKYFLKNVKCGDRLWFVTSKTNGKLIGVASYRSHNHREFGDLINLSMTNEELGWTSLGVVWSIEIHYTDLYNIKCELCTYIKSPKSIRKYNKNAKYNCLLFTII
jgi:hypothetical protein